MKKPNLSIIIPVYNEEKRIEKTLQELFDYQKKNDIEAEILIVDDGSTDKTISILRKYQKKLKIIPVVPNRGKGFAIRMGMLAAEGEKILFMDADLATPLEEIKNIIKESESFDIVIGSRRLAGSKAKRSLPRSVISKTFNLILKKLVPLSCRDSQCGFKIFSQTSAQDIFDRAKIDRWAFDIEVLYLAKNLGYKVKEMPVLWEEKAGSKVKILRDTFLMLRDLLKIRYFSLSDSYGLNNNSYKKEFFDDPSRK